MDHSRWALTLTICTAAGGRLVCACCAMGKTGLVATMLKVAIIIRDYPRHFVESAKSVQTRAQSRDCLEPFRRSGDVRMAVTSRLLCSVREAPESSTIMTVCDHKVASGV